ncbi:MAG TPA: methyltransferase domain-containing protein [Spirochaetota bacterium]|nr:methyltransferase domain-containing protein [Spirochaetota bacterium]
MERDKITERFDIVADQYDSQRRYFIPCYDDYYKTSLYFLASIRKDFASVLDLGAGTGLLSKYLYSRFPNANFTLVDLSKKMIDVAKERFSGMNNFRYIISDYSKELPDGEFDLIASALSIHHLTEEDKINLYNNIYKKLNKNGVFINLDQFNAQSETLNSHYNSWWYKYIENSGVRNDERDLWLKRRELDRENSVAKTIDMLNKAGFDDAECIYSYMKFGVVLAIK